MIGNFNDKMEEKKRDSDQTVDCMGVQAGGGVSGLRSDGRMSDGRMSDGRMSDGRMMDGRMSDGRMMDQTRGDDGGAGAGGQSERASGSYTERPGKGGQSERANGSHTKRSGGSHSERANGDHTERSEGGHSDRINNSQSERQSELHGNGGIGGDNDHRKKAKKAGKESAGVETRTSKEVIEGGSDPEGCEGDVMGTLTDDVRQRDTEIEALKKELEDQEKTCSEYFDRLQRVMAEFDNYKKRTVKEKEGMYDTAASDVIAAFLPVVDSIERAVAATIATAAKTDTAVTAARTTTAAKADTVATAANAAMAATAAKGAKAAVAVAAAAAATDATDATDSTAAAAMTAAVGTHILDEHKTVVVTKGVTADVVASQTAATGAADVAVTASLEEQETDANHIREGIELIGKQVREILNKLSVEKIPGVGAQFDPEYHDAVMHIEDDRFEKNVVAEVFQGGYLYKNKVVRYSMVKVAN